MRETFTFDKQIRVSASVKAGPSFNVIICRNCSQTSSVQPISSVPPLADSHKPTATTVSTESRLLDIYALALSSATPLHLHRATSKKKAVLCIPGALLSGEVDFNQLKYANRQHDSETAGLEIKYNDVIIEACSLLDQAGHQLAHWLSTMTASRRSWLRTITLSH
jgi:hypothetical protein